MRGFTTIAITLAAACFASAASLESSHAANVKAGLRLLDLEDGAEPVWKTEAEKLELMRAFVDFFDVTEVYVQDQLTAARQGFAAPEKATYPSPSHQTEVKALLPNLSTTSMNNYLTNLTAFNNRYYKASTGLQASVWIQNTLKSIAGSRSDITVTAFNHSWVQTSTIAKFAGTSTTAPTTILGAHMDSINLSSPLNGRAPGADDDGTGVVNLIEVFKVLVKAGYKPVSPLEFHFYSGEEAGLLGSQAIAQSYSTKGASVKAMLELDMTGYFKPGTKEAITFMTDNTDAGLTAFVQKLVTAYASIPYATGTCGYACSDHASWYKYKFPSVMPFETTLGNDDPQIHSSGDTTSVNGFSWAHSLEFAKVGLAYAYELTVA